MSTKDRSVEEDATEMKEVMEMEKPEKEQMERKKSSQMKTEKSKDEQREMDAEKDPFQMLMEDHQHVKTNFEEFEKADEDEKYSIFADTVIALTVHTKLEEELVYPLLEQHEDADMMHEAEEEHRVVDFVITEMKELDPSDEKFDAKFKVLSEMVKHHIEEEEGEMFPALREMDIDFDELANNMMERKAELQEEYSDLDAIEPLQSIVTKQHRKSPARKRPARGRATTTKKAGAKASSPRKSASSKKSSGKSKKSTSKSSSKKSTTTKRGGSSKSNASTKAASKKRAGSAGSSAKRKGSTTKRSGSSTKRSGSSSKKTGAKTTGRGKTASRSKNGKSKSK